MFAPRGTFHLRFVPKRFKHIDCYCCVSISLDFITTKFCTCHDSISVVACAKFCSDNIDIIWMRWKWNWSQIWIKSGKLAVKWCPILDEISMHGFAGIGIYNLPIWWLMMSSLWIFISIFHKISTKWGAMPCFRVQADHVHPMTW